MERVHNGFVTYSRSTGWKHKWNLKFNLHLVIHNRGRLPTYECKLGSSIIDVTMSSRLPMRVDNWRVNRSFNGSDHNTIQFQLVIDKIELPEHRNYDKADWA